MCSFDSLYQDALQLVWKALVQSRAASGCSSSNTPSLMEGTVMLAELSSTPLAVPLSWTVTLFGTGR